MVVRYGRRVRAIRRFTVRPVLPPALAPVLELVNNLRWSWHPVTQDLFASMDPAKEVGEVAAKNLIRHLNGLEDLKQEQIVLDYKLILRESS